MIDVIESPLPEVPPNGSAIIDERTMMLECADQRIDFDGQVELHLARGVDILVSGRVPATRETMALFGHSGDLKLCFGDATVEVIPVRINLNDPKDGIAFRIRPKDGELAFCEDPATAIAEMVFHVLNFREVLSLGACSLDFVAETGGGKRRIGRVLLEDGEWDIEIQAVPALNKVTEALKAVGGFGITHLGRLRRRDGETFAVEDACPVLARLHRLLSFARGAWVGVFGVLGYAENGAIRYREYGMRPCSAWSGCRSWLDDHHGEALIHAYPGLARLTTNANFSDAVTSALYWYLLSNSGTGVDAGLILSQAALERLSSIWLAHSGKKRPPGAKEKIGRALEDMEIPFEFGDRLRRPDGIPAGGKWDDAVAAIVGLRNDLVHPIQKLKLDDRGGAVRAAWMLAQWLIELMVLRMSGYDGHYRNRLNASWPGETEQVPWASSVGKEG